MKRPQFLLMSMCLALVAGTAYSAEPEGSFVGVFPCADCPAIDYRLDLFADRVYYQRISYRERGEAGFDQIGSWSLSEDGRTLVLSGQREGPTRFAIEDADKLTMLDRDGNPIESRLNYSLIRSGRLAPLVPRVALRGMFSYFADAALFEDCDTGRRMPVAMEGDYLRLERAWLAGGHSAEAPVMASVQARIVERVNMEGPMRPTVIVERFDGLSPGEQCAPRADDASKLEGTYWRLTAIGDETVSFDDRGREAHVMFQAGEARATGSSGCNRFFGGVSRDGAGLAFGPLASTKMACLDGPDIEQRFFDALSATRSWRVAGRQLELVDASGAVVARFEAAAAR